MGQYGPIDLLLHLEGVPYFQCRPPTARGRDGGVALTTGIRDVVSVIEAENMLQSDLISTASLQISEKLFWMPKLKTSLAEG